MGHILMILCVLFCIGALIFVLSTDAKNVIVDEDGTVKYKKVEKELINKENHDAPCVNAEAEQPEQEQ